jgi:hypothetical protein
VLQNSSRISSFYLYPIQVVYSCDYGVLDSAGLEKIVTRTANGDGASATITVNGDASDRTWYVCVDLMDTLLLFCVLPFIRVINVATDLDKLTK